MKDAQKQLRDFYASASRALCLKEDCLKIFVKDFGSGHGATAYDNGLIKPIEEKSFFKNFKPKVI